MNQPYTKCLLLSFVEIGIDRQKMLGFKKSTNIFRTTHIYRMDSRSNNLCRIRLRPDQRLLGRHRQRFLRQIDVHASVRNDRKSRNDRMDSRGNNLCRIHLRPDQVKLQHRTPVLSPRRIDVLSGIRGIHRNIPRDATRRRPGHRRKPQLRF